MVRYTNPPTHATVSDVVDGDTIHVYGAHGWKISIRVIGINTPEIYGGVECGGRAAKAYAQWLVKPGMHVTLTQVRTTGKFDRYGRALRYVKLPNHHDLGAAMVRSGLAVAAYDSRSYGTHPYRSYYHYLDRLHNYRTVAPSARTTLSRGV